MKINVYYMRPDHFRTFILGDIMPVIAKLPVTHVYLRTIEVAGIEDAYMAMQGEIWSPNGEARNLIAGLGLSHTSMSVGDVVQIDGTQDYFVCASVGFLPLHHREAA